VLVATMVKIIVPPGETKGEEEALDKEKEDVIGPSRYNKGKNYHKFFLILCLEDSYFGYCRIVSLIDIIRVKNGGRIE
jgi:hypothetical protein